MKGVSSAIGSLLLVILISSISFLYIQLVDKTFNSLSNFISEEIILHERSKESIEILNSALDRYFPINLMNNSGNILGNINDIHAGKNIIAYSSKGNISLTFIFENIIPSISWLLDFQCGILSNPPMNITLGINGENENAFQLYKSSFFISNTSHFLQLHVYSNHNLNNRLKINIEIVSNTTSILIAEIYRISIKTFNNVHIIFLSLLNKGNMEVNIISILIFNDKTFNFFNESYILNPFDLKVIILKTNVTYGYIKLITQRGNIFSSPLTN